MSPALAPVAARHRRLAILAVAAVVLAAIGAVGLARTRAGLARTVTFVDGVPVELILPATHGAAPLPGVVVVHGFSGSRQLMYGIAQSLARNGYAAAVVDLPGHGQNPARMAMQPGRPSGFDDPLSRVTAWLRGQPGVDPARVALVGHSMGAGAVLRFATGEPGIGATVAISAGLAPRWPIPANDPRNVLVMAGAWEFPNVLGACRGAVIASYPQADPMQRQGTWADGTARQCVVVPGVEHIGVLFSGTAVTTVVRWLDAALGTHPLERPVETAIPMIPALWLHLAGAIVFLLVAEMLFSRAGSEAAALGAKPLPALGLLAALVGSVAIAAVAMRFVPGGWIPLLTADYLCGFYAVTGLAVAAVLLALGRPIVRPLPSLDVAWRTFVLVTVALALFASVAQLSWLNLHLAGVRRWLAVAVFPAWLLYFLAFDSLLRTRPAREYFAWSMGSAVLTIVVLVAAIFTLRAPFFLLLLAPALLPILLWLGLYGHWLRARTSGVWPAACVAAAMLAWLMAAVFPLV
jgi:dienelactone hydrolase